jgi:fructose-1,6-bisphosphatase/inositol monophosphatase family enzyme
MRVPPPPGASGAAPASFGLLASGRTDAAFDTRLKLWDFAPFRPIIEGAGGTITDWEGRPIDHQTGKRIMAAGDPARHREMLRLVEAAMKR